MLGVNGLKLQLRAGGKAGSSYICDQYRVFSAEKRRALRFALRRLGDETGCAWTPSARGEEGARPGPSFWLTQGR